MVLLTKRGYIKYGNVSKVNIKRISQVCFSRKYFTWKMLMEEMDCDKGNLPTFF